MNPKDLLGKIIQTDIGPITLSSVLGHGSFAVVYKAVLYRHNAFPVNYAIKLLLKQALSPRHLEIQSAEFNLHSRVSDHPNIVRLVTITEDDEFVYLVLDWWKGGDLFDALVSDVPISDGNHESLERAIEDPKACLELFRQIVSGIHHCHQNGVYHRDLKPENILIRRKINTITNDIFWECGITDFGLATDEEWSDEFGCGSVRYMSPECLNDTTSENRSQHKLKKYSTPANDVWSLGVILVNLLSQRNPWKEPSLLDPLFHEWFSLRANESKSFFRRLFGVSKEVEELLQGCFAIDVQKRLTVSQILERVDLFQSNDISLLQTCKILESHPLSTTWDTDSEMDFTSIPVFDDQPEENGYSTLVNSDSKLIPSSVIDSQESFPTNTQSSLEIPPETYFSHSVPHSAEPDHLSRTETKVIPSPLSRKKKKGKKKKRSVQTPLPQKEDIPSEASVAGASGLIANSDQLISMLNWVVGRISSMQFNSKSQKDRPMTAIIGGPSAPPPSPYSSRQNLPVRPSFGLVVSVKI